MDYKFQRKRIDKIPEQKLLEELAKAAKHFNYVEFGWREFNKISTVSAGTIENHFGTWKKGLAALKLYLQQKGLNLSLRPYPANRIYSDKELFEEMERIWCQSGQRPSRAEWLMFSPKFSYGTYCHRFGGWGKACLKFIEYKMGTSILVDNEAGMNNDSSKQSEVENSNKGKEISSRTVPLNIRLKILDRDAYRCVLCGRSPATDLGVKLHIDHKMPFSKGGSSTIDNLQTLCQDCNLGKSDEVYNK